MPVKNPKDICKHYFDRIFESGLKVFAGGGRKYSQLLIFDNGSVRALVPGIKRAVSLLSE
jgi:hypothetical protein